MKNYILFGLVGCLLFGSLSAEAQSRHHNNRRYDDRYDYRRGYPSRTSVSIRASLPFGAVRVSFGQRAYHFYDGYYYSPYNNGYILVDAPLGIVVPSLPHGSVAVVVGSRNYYRFQSVSYLPLANNQYQVVAPPTETAEPVVAADIPPPTNSKNEYEKITIEGKTYYRKNGKYYKASIDDKGEVSYQEVGETAK